MNFIEIKKVPKSKFFIYKYDNITYKLKLFLSKKYYIIKFFFIIIFFVLIFLFKSFILKQIYFKHKKLKICLCAIGKNENLYVKEFVSHYIKLGYNKIIIYDNNEVYGERFEDVIKKEIYKGYVDIINFRGFRGKDNKPQFDAYKDCYEKYHHKFDWLSFFDFDEFLELKPNNIKIQEFLNNKRYKNCQNIKINWLLYINNNSLYYENKPVQYRINIPVYESIINKHIKSTVRGNLLINYWSVMNNPHSSLNNFKSCSSSGQLIDYSSPYNDPPDYEFAILKHYNYKSFEEYCKKINRGRSDYDSDIYKKEMIINLYKDNINNKNKINIMKNIFNISLLKLINYTLIY